jgi:hypothetical protein
MRHRVCVGSTVHCYYADDWYDRGTVIRIVDDTVQVDFLDWIQGWRIGELRATMEYRLIFVPTGPGWLIHNFGQVIPPP